VRVEPDRAYVDHGDVATSAGAGAGFELCLHLVRRDHGAEFAARLARDMAMPPPRAEPAGGDGLDGLVAWADARLGGPLSVRDLAARLGVSPRTLARRFAERLGTSPGAWLLGRRVAAARALLESTDLPVEAIAARVGLGSAVNLRRRFRAATGTTPSAHRAATGATPSAHRAATGTTGTTPSAHRAGAGRR